MMKLGCGIFGLAGEIEKDFPGTMRKLKESGFTAVEPLYGFHNDPALLPGSPVPSSVKAVIWDEDTAMKNLAFLQSIGLTISSMHVGFLFGTPLEDGCRELLSFAAKSGIRHFMTSLTFDSMEKTEEAADLMNRANRMLNPEGVVLGYHNHDMEFGKAEEGQETTFMDVFLEKTAPSVRLQLDVGWQMYGGSDVVSFIKKYPDRILSLHLKDFVKDFAKVPKDDAFAAIGDGALPTAEILKLLPTLHLMENGLMIDQDQASKGKELSSDLEKGAAYLRKLSGDC